MVVKTLTEYLKKAGYTVLDYTPITLEAAGDITLEHGVGIQVTDEGNCLIYQFKGNTLKFLTGEINYLPELLDELGAIFTKLERRTYE